MSDRSTMELLKNHKFREYLSEKWKSSSDGKIHCVNCGSTEGIQWHHIVPYQYGGKDVESNIVPLCHSCHVAVHTMPTPEERNRLAHQKHGSFGGRPSKSLPEGYEEVFWKYLNGKITRIEAAKMIGRSKDFFSDCPQWKEWCEKNHIIRIPGKNFGRGGRTK